MKKVTLLTLMLVLALTLAACASGGKQSGAVSTETETAGENNFQTEEKSAYMSIDITEHYVTHTGNPDNYYRIDEEHILWGSGKNQYGRLGQGTQDTEFYGNPVKIAENVVHIDYSQKGFMIFITEDNKLYGVGNAGVGALQQYEEYGGQERYQSQNHVVTTPILLMEDVVYACCGRSDIVCMKEDGTVWTWGTIYTTNGDSVACFIAKPEQILENAVLVTGGWNNHAALLSDGTVWTWGYNQAENCGVADEENVSEPTMVAENAVMVWTNLAIADYPFPTEERCMQGLLGNLGYCTDYDNIEGFDDVYPYVLNDTVIQKSDGTYWACGAHIGTEERELAEYGGYVTVNCSSEFLKCREEDVTPTDSELKERVEECKIPEQTFGVSLEDWGEVTFVSCEPFYDGMRIIEDISFFLVKDGRVVYQFPYLCRDNINTGTLEVGAVAFRDLNDDGKKDIIIITYRYPPAVGELVSDVRIFLAGENTFYLAKDMMETVEEAIPEFRSDLTVERICELLQ